MLCLIGTGVGGGLEDSRSGQWVVKLDRIIRPFSTIDPARVPALDRTAELGPFAMATALMDFISARERSKQSWNRSSEEQILGEARPIYSFVLRSENPETGRLEAHDALPNLSACASDLMANYLL